MARGLIILKVRRQWLEPEGQWGGDEKQAHTLGLADIEDVECDKKNKSIITHRILA